MTRRNISHLAAVTALLLTRVTAAQLQAQGCVALSIATADDNNALDPNSPELCATYCNNNGYSYLALSLQFCTCWKKSPAVTKTFSNDGNIDCYYNCLAPNDNEFCGGMDQGSGESLFNLYFSPVDGAAPPNNTTTTSTATTQTSSSSSSSSSSPSSSSPSSSSPSSSSPSSSSPSSSSTSAADSSTSITSPRSGLTVTPFLGSGTNATAATTADSSSSTSVSVLDSAPDPESSSSSAPVPAPAWTVPFSLTNSSASTSAHPRNSSASTPTHHRNSTSSTPTHLRNSTASTECETCFSPFRTHVPPPPPRMITSISIMVVTRTECAPPAPSAGDGSWGGNEQAGGAGTSSGHAHGSSENGTDANTGHGQNSGGAPPLGPPEGLLPVAAGATRFKEEGWSRAGWAPGLVLLVALLFL